MKYRAIIWWIASLLAFLNAMLLRANGQTGRATFWIVIAVVFAVLATIYRRKQLRG